MAAIMPPPSPPSPTVPLYISPVASFFSAQRYASVRESERVLRAQQEAADALLEERQGELREAEKRLAELEHGQAVSRGTALPPATALRGHV